MHLSLPAWHIGEALLAIRWLVAFGLSIAMHVFVAHALPMGGRLLAGSKAQPSLSPRLEIRLVRSPPPPSLQPQAGLSTRPPQTPRLAELHESSLSTLDQKAEPPTTPRSEPLEPIPEKQEVPPPAYSVDQALRSSEAIAGVGDYHPPNQLSVAPSIKIEPTLELEVDSSLPMTGTVVLRVFIGQNGDVDKVVPDSEASQLPLEYQHAAAEAFKSAQFSPGEISGRPVGSVLRLEVTFGSPRVVQ